MSKISIHSIVTLGSIKNRKYYEKWEKKHLPIKDLAAFVKDLIASGYSIDETIHYNKIYVYEDVDSESKTARAGSHYRVDFANRDHRHIVEFSGKHHTTKFGKQRVLLRDSNLIKAGWFVTRIPFKE